MPSPLIETNDPYPATSNQQPGSNQQPATSSQPANQPASQPTNQPPATTHHPASPATGEEECFLLAKSPKIRGCRSERVTVQKARVLHLFFDAAKTL